MADQASKQMALAANIPKLYLFGFLDNLTFFVPIYIVFLLQNGLSFTQVMLLEAIYCVLVVALELPTGQFADVKGRKPALLVSSFGYIFAFTFFMLGQSFFHFAAAMVLWAVAGAFRSGTDNALMYDTLLSLKKEKDFPKVLGRAGFIAMAAVTIASIIGGYVADIRITLPFVLTVASATVALLIAFSFKEPPRERPMIGKGHLHKLAEIAKWAFGNRVLVYLMTYDAFMVPVIIVLYFLLQPFAVQLGLPLSVLGLLYAAVTAVAAVGMLIAPYIYQRVNVGVQLLLLSLIANLAAISLAFSKSVIGLGWLLIMALALGTVGIVWLSTINKIITSDKRATVLSLANIISRGLFLGVFSVAIGWLIDLYSLRIVTLLAAAVSLIGGITISLLLSGEKLSGGKKK